MYSFMAGLCPTFHYTTCYGMDLFVFQEIHNNFSPGPFRQPSCFQPVNLTIVQENLQSQNVSKAPKGCVSKPDDFNWCGEGGYLPYGMQGVMTGAATAFYGFVG